MPSRLEESRIYTDHRWNPIPFYPYSKTPAFEEGGIFPYRQRPATIEELTRWFADDTMNIGIITGGDHIVLDIDGPDGEQSIKGLPRPSTPTVLTKRGPHYHFQTERPIRTRTKVLPGVDIIADDWQVLAPSSIHPDGAVYTWAPDLSLADVPRAPAPNWIYDLADEPESSEPMAAIEQPRSSKHKRESLLGLGLPMGGEAVPFPSTIEALGGWPGMLRREDVNLRCVSYLGVCSEYVFMPCQT